MLLALVEKKYKGELICDFAETYHIYDYHGLSPIMAATLLVGLRDNSRTKMKISGSKLTLEQALLAKILDNTNFLVWMNTKDGQHNRNRPNSVLEALLAEPKDAECEGFTNPEDFQRVWAELVGG